MSYKDLGFSKFLTKPSKEEKPAFTEDETATNLPRLSGSSFYGGTTSSPDGRLKIYWDKPLVVISDKARKRVAFGKLEGTNQWGFRVWDEAGNVVITTSETQDGLITVGEDDAIIFDGKNKKITIGTGSEIVIDGTNKRIYVTDGTNNRILLDGSTGGLKISKSGKDVLTASGTDLIFDSSGLSIALGHLCYTIHPGPRQWTGETTYQNLHGTNFKIDGDKLVFNKVYFEILGCVEVEGRTAYYRIYNVTDGEELSSSEVTTTAVSSEAEGWVNTEIVRSSALTFPSGEKLYRLQLKQSDAGEAGDTAQFFKGVLVFQAT